MKRTRINILGKSDSSEDKREIQRLVREIVIARDKTCILRKIRHCSDSVLQADHLITRSNSATYADTRLIVCICRSCHGGYKKWHKPQYDLMVKKIIGEERTKLWETMEENSWRPSKQDWKLHILALKQELSTF